MDISMDLVALSLVEIEGTAIRIARGALVSVACGSCFGGAHPFPNLFHLILSARNDQLQ